MKKILIADIGGTKISAALADENGEMTHRVKVKNDVQSSESAFHSLCFAFDRVLELARVKRDDIKLIGLGVPGQVDSNNGIAVYQNNLPWRDFPLAKQLKERFCHAEIVMDNDVAMAAYGEWKTFDLKKETFVYVTVSTGISAYIISEGRFIRGSGMAGEIGFSTYRESENVKTLEELASGPAIEAAGKTLYNNSGMTTEQVFNKYYEGDPTAAVVMRKTAQYLAFSLQHLFSILDPHVVVIGGGVMNNHPEFLTLIKEKLKPLLHNPVQSEVSERLYTSQIKGESGLYGALYRVLC
ncbi:ROK family protein [Alteribacter populi]|uniref:ROK family protein n=1 Tax=Alteribacter populi TaxID=2011011 RepID=UPI0012FD74B5|nr:ROK family protein [Alteribacter populi]